MLKPLTILTIFLLTIKSFAQKDTTIFPFQKYEIQSKYLNENREFWVSLPMGYSDSNSDSNSYPVIYVLDAEWRFDIIRNISWYLSGDNKIEKSIIIGIPHVDMHNKRGRDLTFGYSRMEYDGDTVDNTWYTAKNSGGGEKFYNFLTQEVITEVNKNYSTNGHETLIGHSYGGYFGLYILNRDHPFEVLHSYDPSVWYSNGEVTKMLKKNSKINKVKVFISYQPDPIFHNDKIEEFIKVAEQNSNIELLFKKFPEGHNGLFLPSFMDGILLTNGLQK